MVFFSGDIIKRFKNVKLQDNKYHLVQNPKTFALRPDIVINDGKIIADTKWKILSEEKSNNGISQADMYQLYAYGTKYQDCKRLYLIYPKDEELEMIKEFQFEEKLNLKILFFDLETERLQLYY